jgi:transposase
VTVPTELAIRSGLPASLGVSIRNWFGLRRNGAGFEVVRSLRRRRLQRRVGRKGWLRTAEDVYTYGLTGALVIVGLSGLVGTELISEEARAQVEMRGPGIGGVAIALVAYAAVVAGSRGGPLRIEEADVVHVFMAPVSRNAVFRYFAQLHLLYRSALGAIAGSIVGLMVAQRLGSGFWVLSLMTGGAFLTIVYSCVAMVSAGRRWSTGARLWMVPVAAWSLGDAINGAVTSPLSSVGRLSVSPSPSGVTFIAVGLFVVGLAWVALSVVPGTSLERGAHRASLTRALTFSVSVLDIRTALFLRRLLADESPRHHPWVTLDPGQGRPLAVWKRDWAGISRWPLATVRRWLLWAVVAGLADTPPRGSTTWALKSARTEPRCRLQRRCQMGFVGGDLQQRFVEQVRGVDRERLLAVPIDVGKSSATALVCDFWGELVSEPVEFALNESGFKTLRKAVARAEAERDAAMVRVGLEQAGHYHQTLLARLDADGLDVVLLNPAQVKANRAQNLLRSVKSDRRDLSAMAELLLRGKGRPHEHTSEALARQAVLAAHRRRSVKARTALKNQVHGTLDLVFPGLDGCFDGLLETKLGRLLVREGLDPHRVQRLGAERLRRFCGGRGVKVQRKKAEQIVQAAREALRLPPGRKEANARVLARDIEMLDRLDESITATEEDLAEVLPHTPAAILTTDPGLLVSSMMCVHRLSECPIYIYFPKLKRVNCSHRYAVVLRI